VKLFQNQGKRRSERKKKGNLICEARKTLLDEYQESEEEQPEIDDDINTKDAMTFEGVKRTRNEDAMTFEGGVSPRTEDAMTFEGEESTRTEDGQQMLTVEELGVNITSELTFKDPRLELENNKTDIFDDEQFTIEKPRLVTEMET